MEQNRRKTTGKHYCKTHYTKKSVITTKTPTRGKVVRCLGPGKDGKEHTFVSDGTPGNRVCPQCRRKQETSSEGQLRVCRTPDFMRGL